jgi:hypothetical protein
MKIIKNFLSGAYSVNILIPLFFIITITFMTGCYFDKKTSTASAGMIDIVVVFKPDVPVEKANSLLFEKEYIFHEGMDSSRGKKYYQETGPKYIVKVPMDKIEAFNAEMKVIPQIYEIYRADYSVNKD